MEKIWLKHYPPGVPHHIDPLASPSLITLLDEGMKRHPHLPAYHYMGGTWRFAEIDAAARHMASYLQGLGLQAGDRVAVMLPNVPQLPVSVIGILRAGMVVVNVNPQFTPRELAFQLQDSGAKAIVILENFAHSLQEVLVASAPISTAVRHVVITGMGDMLGIVKGTLVNQVVRRVRKAVPRFHLPNKVDSFNKALRLGRARPHPIAAPGPDDLAMLQYTGGTTGASKAAMLLHRNVASAVLLSEAWSQGMIRQVGEHHEQLTMVAALPLYHVFGFVVNLMLGLHLGACNILIPDPRDVTATLRELSRWRFHSFPAVNTLFAAMARHPDFDLVDWQTMKQSLGGGTAVQHSTAKQWKDKTGVIICEGYGLSETTAGVTCNPAPQPGFSGSIGLPLPSTEVMILDDEGRELPLGTPGELAVRGPQVMAGYWQRPEETAQAMTADGFLRTGDICVMDEHGSLKLIDRKKDLIKVSGFTVYPTEVEDMVATLRGVRECAVIGMPDAHSGEVVKLYVVPSEAAALTEQAVREHCAQVLTGYKRPRVVVFLQALPRNTLGKVLRRVLREMPDPPDAQTAREPAEEAITEGP